MMKLNQVLHGINCQIIGSAEIAITGIAAHSQNIAPGCLFIARKGASTDGRRFIPDAIIAGAAAILTDEFNPTHKNATQVIHPFPSAIEGTIASNFFQHPSSDLFIAGITGTKGKTTTSYIVKQLLDSFEDNCGLIGTIEYLIGKRKYPATHTTPDATRIHHMLREMVQVGCKSTVMEVTSHALDQRRVDENIDFDAAVFTNLKHDHLDYHLNIENYANAKKKLFDQLNSNRRKKRDAAWAIINWDSPWSNHMTNGCNVNILTYGIDRPADLQATILANNQHGTHAKIGYQGNSIDCYWPYVGKFNAYNCLAAIGVALARQISFEKIVESMSRLQSVRGRLQGIENSLGLKIFVDFAHTADALENVLSTLRQTQPNSGKLIVVFGCGGDRDKLKRPKMAEACEKFSDYCIVTTDNSRLEDPEQICKEITAGFTSRDKYEVELDRKAAIQRALELGKPHDIVLIAGKGHEAYQISAHQTIAFDDAQTASDICTRLASEGNRLRK